MLSREWFCTRVLAKRNVKVMYLNSLCKKMLLQLHARLCACSCQGKSLNMHSTVHSANAPSDLLIYLLFLVHVVDTATSCTPAAVLLSHPPRLSSQHICGGCIKSADWLHRKIAWKVRTEQQADRLTGPAQLLLTALSCTCACCCRLHLATRSSGPILTTARNLGPTCSKRACM